MVLRSVENADMTLLVTRSQCCRCVGSCSKLCSRAAALARQVSVLGQARGIVDGLLKSSRNSR